jgi:diacylglycerol kinase
MLSRLHPEEHEIIGRSKDIASAAVFMAFVFAFFVVVVVIFVRR